MSDHCACGKTLGTNSQLGLPGTCTETQCIDCVTNNHIKHMLALLPRTSDLDFGRLSGWEQEFLESVRGQFDRKKHLSEKQYDRVCQIYSKLGS